MELRKLEHKQYLGAGVYVGYDGYHVVIWLESPGMFGANTIALDPHVLAALEEYRENVVNSMNKGEAPK